MKLGMNVQYNDWLAGAASSASSQDAWVAGASASNRKSILRTSRYSFQQPAPSSPTPTPSAPQFGTDAAPATASGDPASALATRPVAETAPASLLSRALDLPTSLPPEQVCSVDLPNVPIYCFTC